MLNKRSKPFQGRAKSGLHGQKILDSRQRSGKAPQTPTAGLCETYSWVAWIRISNTKLSHFATQFPRQLGQLLRHTELCREYLSSNRLNSLDRCSINQATRLSSGIAIQYSCRSVSCRPRPPQKDSEIGSSKCKWRGDTGTRYLTPQPQLFGGRGLGTGVSVPNDRPPAIEKSSLRLPSLNSMAASLPWGLDVSRTRRRRAAGRPPGAGP